MASAALEDELSCSICLNLYTEPVSLRCGHNFCRNCIVTALDTQEGSGVYTCPECREESVERPTMEKNRKLCNIMENFRSTQVKEESEIFCTYCLDSPAAAIKTCVHCETSMCDRHLTAHNKTVDHVLMEPTTSFSSKKCRIHKKLLEYYCTEDAVCLCVSCCLVGKHKGHKVELLEDAFEKKKLRGVLEKLTMKRAATEQRIETLQDLKRKVQRKEYEKKRVTAMFEDFRRQLEVQEHKVLSEITRQVEEVSRSVIDLTKQLEIQKDELSRKISHMEKICNMTDLITALQDQVSETEEVLQDPGPDTDDRNVEGSPLRDLDDFMISLVLHRSITALITNMKFKSNFCIQESPDLLLDEKTAHRAVTLSDDLRTASDTEIYTNRPKLRERFIEYEQVMSRESFSHGKHYWEAEVSECGNWDVGVCYPSIERGICETAIGNNDRSWAFCKDENGYNAIHDWEQAELRVSSCVRRLGVFLDYEAGRLSYYQLCDPIRHLHTFTATFTEPLHAALYVCEGAWVRLASPVFSIKP